MTPPEEHSLSRLAIPPQKRQRRTAGPAMLLVALAGAVVVGVVVVLATRKADRPAEPPAGSEPPVVAAPKAGDAVLTVSGYVIPRERIELSPKFQGTVKWMGVKKGDAVKKGDVLVRLNDEEFRARLLEAQGRVGLAEANLANAEINLKRQINLAKDNVESERAVDDARRARDAAVAELTTAKGQLALAQTYLDWCTIRAPIDGIVLEKLVDENELVVPQSFGGSRGPSTALVSLADLNDLQVEIDLNEADLNRVHLKQKCRISPEAYPDKKYEGFVAEIAPEANRQKGTLQVKVQIEKPDRYLTPELTAKVEFIAE